jgi:hypothetical protein
MLKLRLRLRLRVCLCLCLFVTQGHLISYSAIQAGGAWLARVLHTFVGLMLSPPSSRVFSRCRPRVLPEPGPRHHLHRLRQGERLWLCGCVSCGCGCASAHPSAMSPCAQVVSHGSDPVSIQPYNYRTVYEIRSYL